MPVLEWLQTARADLLATVDYVSDDNSDAVQRLKDDIEAKAAKLPEHLDEDLTSQSVEREEARESFKQEALASWKAYQDTGRHLTGAEVRDRLKSWGTMEEYELPSYHE
ncbi:CopG family transcriptional regulator [Pseudomonas sp. MWU12-2037]|uniref:type II toxin-antitoxin system RelE/ParE family toxin n=1 Tax=Pseudomonas sp. MWU12-2037 TaxID=2928690 RepID=UPI00201039D7